MNKKALSRAGSISLLVLFALSCGSSTVAGGASCTLPQFQDEYIGFVIGKPAGWSIHYVNGVITVRRDPEGRTTAIAYPVRLKSDEGAEQALREYFAVLRDVSAKAGNRLDGRPASPTQLGEAVLALSGEIGGAPVSGELRARRRGRELLITGGWSDQTSWPQVQSTILEVGQCYRQRSGVSLRRERQTGGGDFLGGATTTYEYALPENWRVSGITFRGIDLNYDDVTGVSFAYLTGAVGNTTPDQWMLQITKMAGFSGLRFLADRSLGSVADPFGMRWDMKAKEYEAVFKGVRVHGVMTAAVSNLATGFGYGSFSAIMALRQSRADQWERFSAITAVLQESIRIVDAKAGQNLLLPRNNPADTDSIMGSWEYKNRVEDRLSARWQESIMGYDNVRSPSTGQTYQMPLNAWNPTGSEGPGYYRPLPSGSSEKLEQVYQ